MYTPLFSETKSQQQKDKEKKDVCKNDKKVLHQIGFMWKQPTQQSIN